MKICRNSRPSVYQTSMVSGRAQTNSGFYYSNILYSQLPNIRIFFFSIGMDEISIIQLYKMSF